MRDDAININCNLIALNQRNKKKKRMQKSMRMGAYDSSLSVASSRLIEPIITPHASQARRQKQREKQLCRRGIALTRSRSMKKRVYALLQGASWDIQAEV
jgi:hypothetical protein